MSHQKFKTPRRKRRNCYDRLRARWLEIRRLRRANSAASASAQLVSLFMVIFGRMPVPVPVPAPYVAPPLSPGQAHRNDVARRLGIPSRYVDLALTQGTVPYSILFDHVRRGGRSREDAVSVLHRRVPESCREWLGHVETWGLWSALLLCHVRHGSDEDTDIRLLKSALAWTQDSDSGEDAPGPAEAGAVLKPGTTIGESYPDDDTNKPKP